MQAAALDWLTKHHEDIVRGLADLVAIQSISTDGEHDPEIDRTAKLTCDQMREAGLHNVEVLKVGDIAALRLRRVARSARQADRLPLRPPRRAAGQLRRAVAERPVEADPPRRPALRPRVRRRQGGDLRPARRHRRLPQDRQHAAGATSRCWSRARRRSARRTCSSSSTSTSDRLKSDVIVVCDTENIEVGLAEHHLLAPRHRGGAGGGEHREDPGPQRHGRRRPAGRGHRPERDPRPAVLGQRPAADPRLLRQRPAADRQGAGGVRQAAVRRRRSCGRTIGVVPGARFATEKGYNVYEQTWRRPAVTVIAQEASSIKGASNQVLPKASAIVSCRIVPDQKPERGCASS